MNPGLIGVTLLLVWFVFAIPATILLLRSYGRTRMSAFLWLLVALVAWPALARFLTTIIGMLGVARFALSAGSATNFFVGLNVVETLIGGTLLVVALYLLDRQLTQRLVPPPPSPPSF